MRQNLEVAGAAFGLALLLAGGALAQSGGEASPGGAVPKPAVPDAPKNAKAAAPAGKPADVAIAGNFSQWALVCGTKDKAGKEPCSLVQALVERDSQKLVFRLTVAYGPKGNLVLRVDSPTGVALQKGLEFSPDAVKIYRLPFQACLAQGCSAVLAVPDDLRQELIKSEKGTITVFALNGQAVRAVTELKGINEGLAALDKRRPKP